MYLDLPSPPIPELASKNETIINHDVTTLVHSLKNRRGEPVCEDAIVSIRTFDDPRTQLHPTSKYLYEPILNFVNDGLIPYYQSFGIDMFGIDGIAVVRDELTEETNIIAPIFVAVDKDGLAQIIDGHDRAYLAILHHQPINAIVVEGVDLNKMTDGLPVSWDDVKVYDRFPQKKDKKNPRPGVELADMVDLSPLGSRGRRVEWLAKEAPYFHESPLRGQKKATKELKKQINRLLDLIDPDSPQFEGMFPSAVDGRDDDLPSRVEKLTEVIPIDKHHFMPVLSIKWSIGDGNERTSIYRPFCETKEKFSRRASQVIILPSDQPVTLNNHIPPDGEVAFPSDIRAAINQELEKSGLQTIATEDTANFGTETPQISGFHFVTDNSRYFIVGVIESKDAPPFGFIINRKDKMNEIHSQGTEFIMRKPNGNIVMVEHYRELFGMVFLELPRMFGYSTDRLFHETGYELSKAAISTPSLDTLPENRSVSSSVTTVLSVDISPDYTPEPIPGNDDEFFESSHVVEYSDQEIHQKIVNGELYCKIDNAGITRDQFAHDKLIVNPAIDPESLKVVVEKYYFAPEGRYYFRPPKTITGAGMRIGKNSFPNTGTILTFDHVELGDANSVPQDVHCQEFTVKEIVEMMKDGRLDSDAIADFSTAFRTEGILVIN